MSALVRVICLIGAVAATEFAVTNPGDEASHAVFSENEWENPGRRLEAASGSGEAGSGSGDSGSGSGDTATPEPTSAPTPAATVAPTRPPTSAPTPTPARSPPPPSPMQPPGNPGAVAVVVHSTHVTMTAAGAVSDYTPVKRTQIADAFATNAGVTRDAVTLTITAGSVIIQAKIVVASAAAATAAETSLSTALATTAAATNFFSSVAGGVAVETVPVIVAVQENLIAYPPPMPAGSTNNELSGGAIAGIVIGTLIGTGALLAIVYFVASGGGAKGGSMGGSTTSGVQFTSAMGQQENV